MRFSFSLYFTTWIGIAALLEQTLDLLDPGNLSPLFRARN